MFCYLIWERERERKENLPVTKYVAGDGQVVTGWLDSWHGHSSSNVGEQYWNWLSVLYICSFTKKSSLIAYSLKYNGRLR